MLLLLLISAIICHSLSPGLRKAGDTENLTLLTTFAVNKAAGRKKSNQQVWQRKNYPDVMTNMASNKGTLSDAIAQAHEEYAAISTSDLRLTIQKTKPNKPSVDPTTSTSFEIIELKSKAKFTSAQAAEGN